MSGRKRRFEPDPGWADSLTNQINESVTRSGRRFGPPSREEREYLENNVIRNSSHRPSTSSASVRFLPMNEQENRQMLQNAGVISRQQVQNEDRAQQEVWQEGQPANNSEYVVQGFRFRIRNTVNRRWRNFHTQRRMFAVDFIRDENQGDENHHLFVNLRVTRALYEIILTAVEIVRSDHRSNGRAENALALLTIRADGLDYPVSTGVGGLFQDSLITELFGRVDQVLTSKQSLSLELGFGLDITIIDNPQQPEQIWAAGRRRKVYKDEKLWTFNRPLAWKKKGIFTRKGFYPAPFFEDSEDLFKNCCILSVLAFAKARQRSQDNVSRGENPCTKYKILERYIKKAFQATNLLVGDSESYRVRRAIHVLREEMRELVSDHNLNIEVFRNCDIYSPAFREEIEKLDINVTIYKDVVFFKPVFQYPRVFDLSKPSVQILLVRTVDNLYHAVFVAGEKALSNDIMKLKTFCKLCRKSYSRQYYHRHKCPYLCRREISVCKVCNKIVYKEEYHKNLDNEEMFCVRLDNAIPEDENQNCGVCDKRFKSLSCKKGHEKICNKNYRYCEECKTGYIYDAGRAHECGTRYCRVCQKYVPNDDKIDSDQGGHHCEMRRPMPQTKYSRVAFFDFESVVKGEDKRHYVNAAGLSYEREDQVGSFDDIYFYDDEMCHSEDGILREKTYEYKYWTDDFSEQELKTRWKIHVPDQLHGFKDAWYLDKTPGAHIDHDDSDDDSSIDTAR